MAIPFPATPGPGARGRLTVVVATRLAVVVVAAAFLATDVDVDGGGSVVDDVVVVDSATAWRTATGVVRWPPPEHAVVAVAATNATGTISRGRNGIVRRYPAGQDGS